MGKCLSYFPKKTAKPSETPQCSFSSFSDDDRRLLREIRNLLEEDKQFKKELQQHFKGAATVATDWNIV